jgi:hypothetical protein
MSKLDDIFDQAGMDESQQVLAKIELKILMLQIWADTVHKLQVGQPWSLTSISNDIKKRVEEL